MPDGPTGERMERDAPSLAPSEVAPAVSDKVALVQKVRSGGKLHGEKEAIPYANSIEDKKSNHTVKQLISLISRIALM